MSNLCRPTSLSEMVGCENIKKLIEISLHASKIKNTSFPNSLLVGEPGLGKSALAQVISIERGTEFFSYDGGSFKQTKEIDVLFSKLKDLRGYREKPNGDVEIVGTIWPPVIYMDEVHQLSKKLQDRLLIALEEGKFCYETDAGKQSYWIPKFSFLASTSQPNKLNEAFRSRFGLCLTLLPYSIEELVKIISNYASKLKLKVEDKAFKEIALRSRGVARKAINYLDRAYDIMIFKKEKSITVPIVEEAFGLQSLDKKGLTVEEREILKHLFEEYPKKVSVERLASCCGVNKEELMKNIEPYLVRERFVSVSQRGRVLTTVGRDYCLKTKLGNKGNTTNSLSKLF